VKAEQGCRPGHRKETGRGGGRKKEWRGKTTSDQKGWRWGKIRANKKFATSRGKSPQSRKGKRINIGKKRGDPKRGAK